jgi:hypothetical protein
MAALSAQERAAKLKQLCEIKGFEEENQSFVDVASALQTGAGNGSGVGSGMEGCMTVLSRLPRERHGFDLNFG